MKFLKNNLLKGGSVLLLATTMLTACNDDLEQFSYTPPTNPNAGLTTIAEKIGSEDTLFARLLKRGGLYDSLMNGDKQFTVWVPSDAAMTQFAYGASQGQVPLNAPPQVVSGFISTALPVASARSIAMYNIAPGIVNYDTLSSAFANVQYPTLLNPMPSVSPFLRLSTYPSPRNGNFNNNIPVTSANNLAKNGIIHKTYALSVPPSSYLWNRISSDTSLSMFKAAIDRADSVYGTDITKGLRNYLNMFGPEFTVFAPTNYAFKETLYPMFYPLVYGSIYQQAYQGALAQGADQATAAAFATNTATTNAPTATTGLVGSPAVFSNPQLYPYLTAQTVQGIVYYHILGKRAFTNNFFTTSTNVPTLLNQAIAQHPGVALSVTLTGPMVTAATVKGAANATATSITLNPMPNGSSDQHYINGVLHKINQLLLPQ